MEIIQQPTMQERLKALKLEKIEVNRRYAELGKEIKDLQIQITKEATGLTEGDVIDVENYRGKIVSWWIWSDKAVPVIALVKKDGTFGNRTKSIYRLDGFIKIS